MVFSPRRRGPADSGVRFVLNFNQIAPRQIVALSDDDRRLSAISKDRSCFCSWFPFARRPMIISMEKRSCDLRTHFGGIDWDFDQIILGHGAIVESNGKEVFRAAFRWLFEVISVRLSTSPAESGIVQ